MAAFRIGRRGRSRSQAGSGANMGREPDKGAPRWTRHAGVGIEFAAAVAAFALVGYWIDRHYQTGPWGVLIGAGLGLIGGTYNLVRESLAAFRESDDTTRDDRDGQSGE